MSRFNEKSNSPTKVENLAGGESYVQTPELELLSVLLTSFAKNEFYRDAEDSFDRVKELIPNVNPEFAAKATIYARNEFGMRSISHVMASELAKYVSGKSWGKSFYDKVVRRVDDMTEIISYHQARNGKISNAMKDGFAKAFDKFDGYQLGKYRKEGKGVKLIDVVNMVHPEPVKKNAEALKALVNDTLRSSGTWENELSKAGPDTDKKHDAWQGLLAERKIGYFALLRNLRNILQQAPDMVSLACDLLVDEKLIRNSLVLPFRYTTALQQFSNNPDATSSIVQALNKAVDLSCANVPKFEGKTLVVCDYSGSMADGYNSHKYKASLFGAIFARANNSDFMIFGDSAEYLSFNPSDSTLSIVSQFVSNNQGWGARDRKGYVGHGTNFSAIFTEANKAYDRILIFSDMQGWMGYNSPVSDFNSYKKEYNASPKVYSIDMAGYGTMQFPQSNVFCLAGFSEKIFDIMKYLETDKQALINTVNAIEL